MTDPSSEEANEGDEWVTWSDGKRHRLCSEECLQSYIQSPRTAYFSMEIALKKDIPTYSGGLGVLAGDVIRSSADLKIPLVAVTLVSKKGYVRQKLTPEGEQLDYTQEWDLSQLKLMPSSARVRIGGREVAVQAWLYEHESLTGGVVPVLFLDTDVEGNDPEDRRITDTLYGGDEKYRLKQEIILGVGGMRVLESLDFRVRNFHMNEGHSSLLTLALLKKYNLDEEKVKNLCIFTTHTPVEAAFDKFPYGLVEELLNEEFPFEFIKDYGCCGDKLNMTFLALRLSKYVNGVTQTHMELSRKLFPGYQIKAITNGVHSYYWTCPSFRSLFDRYVPGWANEPEMLARVEGISNREMWAAHMAAKRDLLDFVEKKRGIALDEETLTIGFARRASSYKRTTFVFSDVQALRGVNAESKIQLIFAGNAHPMDGAGKGRIREVFGYAKQLEGEIPIAYLENYDLSMAEKLISGVDLWLNTPLPPMEASGTSGMKAAHNGVLNFSVLDGWWVEGCVEGRNGWAIGPGPAEEMAEDERRMREIQDLYGKLRYNIAPTFYSRRDEWTDMMRKSITLVATHFNSHRMMRRYALEAYYI